MRIIAMKEIFFILLSNSAGRKEQNLYRLLVNLLLAPPGNLLPKMLFLVK